MKVLLISPLPPPVGGIASWTVNILEYYDSHQNIKLIHLNTAIKYRNITRLDSYSRIRSGIKSSQETIKDLLRELKKHTPDVIHLTSSASLGLCRDLLILLGAKIYKVPVVIHYRFGRIPTLKTKKNWEWRLLLRASSLASAVLVLDTRSKEVLELADIRNVYLTPNPISTDLEASITSNPHIKSQVNKYKNQVLFVGHITENKGVIDLVRACCLVEAIDGLTLVGPYEDEIKAQLIKLASSNNLKINFTGVLQKRSVLAKMRDAALLVLPSHSEGFPNVIIEAMAVGCPIIATDVGAIPDMLDINTTSPAGVVVKPRDIHALSKAMMNILDDQDIAKTYSENAINKVINHYTLDKVCSLYESIWQSVTPN